VPLSAATKKALLEQIALLKQRLAVRPAQDIVLLRLSLACAAFFDAGAC